MSRDPASFESFLERLTKLSAPTASPTTLDRAPFLRAAVLFGQLEPLNRETLTDLVRSDPSLVPILGSVVGLSQEQVRNTLKDKLDSSGWVKLAKRKPQDVVSLFDETFALIERLREERGRQWSYGDILFERTRGRASAGRAISRGRDLENEIEAIVKGLGLPFELRTRFVGSNKQTAPCDVAIPAGGEDALIVCAIKGFDSTGSKLTAAVTEIETMANIRDPRQFVYAVVDGIGWKSRQADLRRIHRLATDKRIQGLYSLATKEDFRLELIQAARIHRLLD